MTKTELVRLIASTMNVSIKDAQAFLDTFITSIEKSLVKGKKVAITGFLTFEVKKTKARKGRNPSTGKEITIPAGTRVVVRPGKALKESVKKK